MSSFVALFATDKVSGRRDKWDKSEDLPCVLWVSTCWLLVEINLNLLRFLI